MNYKINRYGLLFFLILAVSCESARLHRSDPYIGESHSEVALIEAVRRGDINTVRSLVATGVDVNVKDHDMGAPPLIWAIVGEYIDIAQLLLENGAQVDEVDRWGRTALHVAVRSGTYEGTKFLLAHGANVNWKNDFGRTPLSEASTYQGTAEITKLLLESGASEGLQEALALAVYTGRFDTGRILINAGANVNSEYPPLLIAVKMGSDDFIDLLLGAGADVNGKDNSGTTALILATLFNYERIVKVLLKAGADVNAITKSDEVLDIMVSAGADKDAISETGVTALMLAEKNGSKTVINMLHEANANR